jgi:MFS family permease
MPTHYKAFQFRTWGIVFACSLAGLIPEVSGSLLNQALGSIVAEFRVPITTGQLIISISKLLLAALVLPGGSLGDAFGRRKLLLIGTIGMGVSAPLSAMATSSAVLLILRALDGVFSALVTPLALATLISSLEKDQGSLMIGVYLSILGAGSLLIPYPVAFLLERFSWRLVFLVSAGMAMLATAALFVFVPVSKREPQARKVDIAGALLASAGLLGVVFAIIESNRLGWANARILGSLFAGIVLLFLFVGRELRNADPMLDLGLFRDRTFATAVAVGMVIPFVGAGLSLPLLYYFRAVGMDTPSTAALKIMPLGLATALVSPVAGKLTATYSPRSIMTAGLALMALGALGLSPIRPNSEFVALAFPMVLIGAGTALAVTQRTSIILSAVPAQQTGAASGINTTSGKLGSVLGTAIMTTMFLRLLRSDYVDRMNPSGLSAEQLRQFTQEWRHTVRDNASVNSLSVPPELVRDMETAFKDAFSASFGKAELLAALLLFSCAAVVWLGLRNLPVARSKGASR